MFASAFMRANLVRREVAGKPYQPLSLFFDHHQPLRGHFAI